ncbi:hypothetical protein EDD15DRAFT_2366279 [Pisolithus albus]|nr:hypothetical protein EDD15DRAFT_2366279 [Pisolithus albus]
MSVLPPFHTPGMATPLCPVVPPLTISQLDPDNTIRDFLDANLNAPWNASLMPTANWTPPLPQSHTIEQGSITPDTQPLSSALPFASGVLPDSGNPGSSSGNNDFTKTGEDTDRPEVPTDLGAQKASWAIACQQRAMKKALLDNAVQEYLTQQTSKLEEIAFKHNITVEYLKGLVGGQTYYHNP